MSDEIKPGDYVLATKWSDGNPRDHWCIGLYHGQLDYSQPCYQVVDSEGSQFGGNGFRRIKKISAARGEYMLANMKNIELGSRSVWWWSRCSMKSS